VIALAPSSEAWVRAASADLGTLLVDHAHCEMKAASNALSLAVRAAQVPGVVGELVALAEEELCHFRRVFAELERRKIPLGPPPPDGYAAELRKIVRARRDAAREPEGWQQTGALVDRLLVAALIEARSCERFRLLAQALAERANAELSRFYEELLAAEARHFRTFVRLARNVGHPHEARVDARLDEVARMEGELSSRLAGAPAIHG